MAAMLARFGCDAQRTGFERHTAGGDHSVRLPGKLRFIMIAVDGCIEEAWQSREQRRARRTQRRCTTERGVVVTYALVDSVDPDSHEARTRAGIATKLAELKGFEFAGEYDRGARYDGPVYFVPSDALSSIEAAQALGIHGEDDLFGGVVPHGFVATKVITHPLFDAQAHAPPGWVPAFPQAVAGSVLEGFSAFAREDAQRAGARLLERGPVRVKRATGIGGRGQFVVKTRDELADVLGAIEAEEFSTSGVVVEENLDDVTTYSVGQVRVAGLLASYCGTQRLTTNNRGAEVYGGSDLFVVRGDFDALLRFPLTDAVRLAIAQARAVRRGRARMLPGLLRFAAQLRRDAGHRCAGTAALGRPRAIVADRRRERRRGRSARSVPRRPRTGVGARRFRRDLRREPAAARGCGGLFSRRRRARRPAHQVQPGRARCRRTTSSLTSPSASSTSPARWSRRGRSSPASCSCMAGAEASNSTSRGHARWRRWAASASRSTCAATCKRVRSTKPSRARTTCATSLPPTTCSRRIRSVDTTRMAVVGSSYGGYLAAILTSQRPVKWLALRAPALYKDSDWELAKRHLKTQQDLEAYRRLPVRPEESRALRACTAFTGDVLIVESEHDLIVPHQVLVNYREACVAARSLTHRVIEDADHGLSEAPWQQAYTSLLVSWLSEMLFGAKIGKQVAPGETPHPPRRLRRTERAAKIRTVRRRRSSRHVAPPDAESRSPRPDRRRCRPREPRASTLRTRSSNTSSSPHGVATTYSTRLPRYAARLQLARQQARRRAR